MVETAGMKLRRMRVLRQLSLVDAARQTRISAARLGDLESDEYSNFPNLAYAKSFLRSYARFLSVDLQAYVDAFEDANTFGLDDYQYLSEKPVGVYRIPRRPQRTPKLRRRSLLMTASLVGICCMVVVGWFFYITYKRLGGNLSKLADRQEAQAHGDLRPGAAQPAGSNSGAMIPVSATPQPAGTASPAPASSPSEDDSTGGDLMAVTLAAHSPKVVLPHLALPVGDASMTPATMDANPATGILALRPMLRKTSLLVDPATAPAATEIPSAPGPGTEGNRYYVHRPDGKPVDAFRANVPRSQGPIAVPVE